MGSRQGSRYDDQVLTLFNQGKTNVNVANLKFIQSVTRGSTLQFDSQEWDAISNRPITSLHPGDCLQVIRNDRFLSASNTKPDYCDFVQAWRQISTQRLFWVSAENQNCFLETNGRYWHGAPDLVVEILSPSTELNDRGTKFQTYQKYGVREYWILDEAKQEMLVLRRSGGRWRRIRWRIRRSLRKDSASSPLPSRFVHEAWCKT